MRSCHAGGIRTPEKRDLSVLYEWGSTTWVKKRKPSKLDSKVQKGNFVGFDEESKGYRIYWQSNDAQIEGDWDILTNSDTSQAPNNPKDIEQTSKTIPDASNIPKILI